MIQGSMPPVSSSFEVRNRRDDIDLETKWWNEYPNRQYVSRARPQKTLESYVTDVFARPKRLARSASFTNLTYVKETEHDLPIKRTPSVSSLAPSLALPQYMREAQRIVHTVPVYKPSVHNWYNGAYSRARHTDTLREIARPAVKAAPYVGERSSHVPFYTMQTRRIFFDNKLKNEKSYLKGSMDYQKNYLNDRLKIDDYANRFAYSAYEWRRPNADSYNSHVHNFGVEVMHAPGLPSKYMKAWHPRRIYKSTEKFNFGYL